MLKREKMVHKRYIKKNGKLIGPYYYESYRENGQVKKRYLGNVLPDGYVDSDEGIVEKSLLISAKRSNSGFSLSVKSVFMFMFLLFIGFMVVLLVFNNANTSMVVLDLSPKYSLNEALSGHAIIKIDSGDYLPADSAVYIKLVKDGEVVAQKTESLNDFFAGKLDSHEILDSREVCSDVNCSGSDDIVCTRVCKNESVSLGNVYDSPGRYERSLEDILSYNLTEAGQYEITFAMPTFDVAVSKTFDVVGADNKNVSIYSNSTNESVLIQNNVTIKTTRARIKLGQPVKWTKNISLDSPGNVTVEIPAVAENVDIKKVDGGEAVSINDFRVVTGNVISQQKSTGKGWLYRLFAIITGKAIDGLVDSFSGSEVMQVQITENSSDYVVEYETPAPTATEREINGGKEVIIFAPSELNYTDVLSFTSLDNTLDVAEKSRIKIYWEENKSYVSFDAYDLDGNGKLDYIEWVTPHLSSQTFYITTQHNDLTPPVISFVAPPTPENGSTVVVDNFNVSMATSDDHGDHYALLNFNNSLVGWWRGENNANDSSGNGNNGQWIGNDSYVDGQFGQAFNFNGASEVLLDGNDDYYLNVDNYFSIAAWVYQIGNSSLDQTIISKWCSADCRGHGVDQRAYALTISPNSSKLMFRISTESGQLDSNFHIFETTNDVVALNDWTFVVATFNGTTRSIYIDGTFNESAEKVGDILSTSTAPVTIGDWSEGGAVRWAFNGSIDDVLIFNRTLSASEIASLYNATANQYNNNFTNLSNGNYIIQGFAVDSAGNVNNTETRTITVDATYDLTPPLITVSSPVEGTNYTTDQIYIDFAAVDDVAVDKMWFNNGTANVSYTDPVNLSLDVGDYTFTFYANDTNGNENSSSVSFSVGDPVSFSDSDSFIVGDPGTLVSCGIIDTPGVYTLARDLNGTGLSSDCLIVNADDVTIEGNGHKIIRTGGQSYSAVYVNTHSEVVVQNLNMSGFNYGVYLNYSTNCQILNNNMSSMGLGGVHFYRSNYSIVQGNYMSGCPNGVGFDTSCNFNTIRDNIITTGGGSGLNIWGGSDSNWVVNNVVSGSDNNTRIEVKDSSDNILEGNNLTFSWNSWAIWLNSTSNTILVNNNLFDDHPAEDAQDIFVQGTSLNNQLVYNNSDGEIRWTNTTFMDDMNVIGKVGGGNLTFPGRVLISNNFVYFNSTAFAGQKINSSANVTLYGMPGTFTNPVIIRDGDNICNSTTSPPCYNFTDLNAASVVFNVSSWSNYSIAEGPDTTAPVINIISPINGSNDTNGVILVHFEATDNIAVDSLWFNNGTDNITYSGLVLVNASEGVNTFTFYANDTSGNLNSTSVTFNVDILPLGPGVCDRIDLDEIFSTHTILMCGAGQGMGAEYGGCPYDVYVRTKTIVHIDDYLLINSNLSHKVTESDCGGSPDCNGIVSLGDIPADTNLSVVGNGSLIIIPANTPISLDLEDTCGVFVGAYGTLEFVNAGTTPPSITVNSPIDGVNYTSGSILVNFSASSDIGVDKMWFNNGTANVSYTDPVNISLDVGDHTFTFYANDTNGNENSTTVNFDVLGPLNAGDVYYCGIIDSPGVYTLAVDVLASWSFDCFVINSDDVVLDGNDHRIDGAYNNSLYNHGIVANGRDNITIQGFSQIAGFYSGSGVEMVDSQNVDITRNIISNNWYNIYFDGVSNSFIEGNELSYAWSSGVQVNSGSNNVISGNSLTRDVNGEFGQGIYLKSTSNNFISENSITTENVGIKLESADSNTFLNNNLSEIFNNSFLDLGGCTNNRLVYNNSFGQVVWTSDSLLNNLTTTGAEGYSGIIFTNDSGTPGRLSIQLNNSYLGSGFVPSELNSSANITLYGMPGTFTNPFIAKDGVECTDCYNFTSLNAETVVFNVSSWSNYYITRFIDFTPPTIEFVGPTPADLEIVNVDNFNVSMATSDDYGDHYALLNFNNSLVGWWRFEGSDDYFLGDDSGNNNNGTAYGIITRADGMFGEAAVLNGISYIDSALLTASALNESGTINIWAKSDAWSTDNYLFNFGSSCDGVIFLRQEFGSMDLIYKNETGAVKIISTFTKPSLGTWVDYSVSWDSIDSKIRLYENGVIVVNYTWTDGFNSAPENQFDYLMFGHCEHIRFWNGSLDDITLFSRALSASEIASLYNATANQYNNNFTNLSNLDYEIQGFAVDGAGNMAQTEIRSITVDATYDLTPPLITVSSPVEGTNYTTDQIYIDFAAVDDVAVDKMWFNNGTANVSYTDPVNISLDVGDYTFTFYANDTSGNENSTLVTFMVDTIPPVVTIVIPTNTTYVSIRYDINIMLNEAGYCLFSLDGGATNQTLTNNGGTSFTGTNSIIADANYTLNAYCNDSAGNRNDSVSVNFSVKLPVCGNGVVEYGESCDAGADNGVCPRSCSSSCTTNSCGGGRPSCRSTSWNCGNWGECVGSSQSRSCIDNCASTKTETQSCTPIINCTSTSWNCGNWSNCTNSLQTRSCLDNCNASRVENQTCIVLNETCMPNWQCSSWGVCNNSISTRSCSDLNNCGDISLKPTESISCFVLPQNESQNQTQEQTIIPVALLQDRQDNCMPVVVCGNYSDCKYSASVNDLFAGVVRSTGTQSRECADSKKCISNYFEQRTCSVEVAVDLVNEADPCDLDKQIVAVVRKGTKDPIAQIDALSLINSNLLNVKFIQNSTVYCEKCYNGIKDDGEEDIDCGGSCKPCQFGSSWINLVKWILWILVLILLIIDLWLIWGEKKREDEIDYRQRIATSQMNKKSFDKSILEDKHIYENKKIEYSSAFKFNTKLREIVDLINKGYSAMDINEIGLARLNYRKVRKKYNTLNSGDKSRIRSKILEFYNEIIYFEPR